jgi:hypothetical protein
VIFQEWRRYELGPYADIEAFRISYPGRFYATFHSNSRHAAYTIILPDGQQILITFDQFMTFGGLGTKMRLIKYDELCEALGTAEEPCYGVYLDGLEVSPSFTFRFKNLSAKPAYIWAWAYLAVV